MEQNQWLRFLALALLAVVLAGNSMAQLQSRIVCLSAVGFSGSVSSDNYQLFAIGSQSGSVSTAASAHYQLDAGAIHCLQLNTIKPMLTVNQDTLDFGEIGDSLSLKISNSTVGTLTWTITENPDKPWLVSINPDSGKGEGTVIIKVDRGQLSDTSDTTFLSITSNGGNKSVTVLILNADNTTSIDNETIHDIPKKYSLQQNYPNPFNPVTTIKYSIPRETRYEIRDVRLIICDILGRKIETLVNEKQKPGYYEVDFDGSELTSGIYFYRLQVYAPGRTGVFVETKKMLMIK